MTENTETLATDAGTTDSVTPASADTKTALTGTEGDGIQKTEPATEDQKAEDKPAEGSEGKTETEGEYVFTFEEGREVDPASLDDLKALAKELGLPQDKAQAIANLGAKQADRWLEAQQKALETTVAEWQQSARTDKEFGGDKFDQNLAVAKKALDTFGTPELRTLLEESRLGDHPEILRWAYRAGKAIADDSVVPGGRSTNGERKPFYDNSNHN